jgi:hypothetical protein
MAMVLSTTTFARDPGKMTMIRADKICSHSLTYSGVAFFSWGATIVGKVIDLEWNAMPSTQFDAIDTVMGTDATCVFDPDITGSTQTYEVNILGFDGDYFLETESSARIERLNCKLSLLIMSEV